MSERSLAQGSVGPVRGAMLDVFGKDCFEVTPSEGEYGVEGGGELRRGSPVTLNSTAHDTFVRLGPLPEEAGRTRVRRADTVVAALTAGAACCLRDAPPLRLGVQGRTKRSLARRFAGRCSSRTPQEVPHGRHIHKVDRQVGEGS